MRADGTIECGGEDRSRIRSIASNTIVTQRIATGDCSRLDAAREARVYAALERALDASPERLIDSLVDSGERGRGGAGFSTGEKWRRAARTEADTKVAIANGDEGDPGSFVDRVLLERDSHAVLEGLALCAYAIGASSGIVYVRAEYPEARRRMRAAVDEARAAGVLGPSVLGSRFAFDVEVVSGLGSYVCGEETALLNALEGRRGEVRVRPPYPSERGLHGRPTVVNNVETLVNVGWIVRHGAEAFRALGTERSSGTKVLSLNSRFGRPGLLEVELGTRLSDALAEGALDASIDTVLLGGPMGSVVPRSAWDVPLCYDALRERGIELGHGGLVALPPGVDRRALAEQWLAFMAEESCGKCVPCRIGSQRALERVREAPGAGGDSRLHELLGQIARASLCAFGRRMPLPVRDLLTSERQGPLP
jgi:NADH:ubiquinone oxidoreductase subunit F (NADH-binding)